MASKKRELVIAKKILPRGDAKNKPIAATVPRVPRISFTPLSPPPPPLPPPPGGRLYMEQAVVPRLLEVVRWFALNDGALFEIEARDGLVKTFGDVKA